MAVRIFVKHMSSIEQMWDSYNKVDSQFYKTKITYPLDVYPEVVLGHLKLPPEFINELLASCIDLFNQIDTMIETLKLTLPVIYEEQKDLIDTKILGVRTRDQRTVKFCAPTLYNRPGALDVPSFSKMPSGIREIIRLLTESFEDLQADKTVSSHENFYTALISFRALKAALTRFCGRFSYVVMFPHRIIVDRKVLEIGLRKHGMFPVLSYLQSAEEHFNNQKYVEFCAVSRNALHKAISSTCLLLDGEEHDFPTNLNRLKEIGFFKGTISKQLKEFSGSLSACGSHPPTEELTNDEAKFLIDSLYSFVGLMSLRLSTFKKPKT